MRKPGVRRIRLASLSPSRQETYRRVLDAVKVMRDDSKRSLTRAAREAGTTAPTVRRYAASALSVTGRRTKAKASDRLRRDLVFYEPNGQIVVTTHSSRQASAIAKYHNAVRAYLLYGDDSALTPFEGKSIVVHGKTYPFVTDRRVLSRLARAGELHFLELYADGGAK